MPTPAQHVRLGILAEKLETAPHGEKSALIAEAAREFGVTVQTVHRWLADHRVSDRKRRADAGSRSLSREDAMKIALAMKHGISATGKRRMTLKDAVETLRADDMISAERIDEETGEVLPLSLSAISAALKAFNLDADSLATPAPRRNLMSPHPNYCWQVDASVCVVFYLPKSAGVRIIDEREVYKNRPDKAKAIELFRVIRYALTDHYSGVIRFRYYPHAESGEATCDFLAWAMAGKNSPHARAADSGDSPPPEGEASDVRELAADPFHGCPMMVMVDPGATASNKVKKFCKRMGIRLIVNSPHKPRAKGQVEQAQNLVETRFESGLLHVSHRVRDFHELNTLAEKYQVWFNATQEHTRTKTTRFGAWMRITKDQLVSTVSYEALRRLITGREETPRVTGDLTARFMGRRWDVRQVPGVLVGKTVTVAESPFTEGGAVAIVKEADGRETHVPLTEVIEVGDSGFLSNAAMIGEAYSAMPDTEIERNKKELLMTATGAKTLREAEAKAARKGFQPFGTAFNPYKRAEAEGRVLHMPRPTTTMPEALPEVAPRIIPAIRAAKLMRDALGDDWNPDTYDWLTRRYSDGIPETTLNQMIENAKGGNQNVATM
jgi:hypothetical protein